MRAQERSLASFLVWPLVTTVWMEYGWVQPLGAFQTQPMGWW